MMKDWRCPYSFLLDCQDKKGLEWLWFRSSINCYFASLIRARFIASMAEGDLVCSNTWTLDLLYIVEQQFLSTVYSLSSEKFSDAVFSRWYLNWMWLVYSTYNEACHFYICFFTQHGVTIGDKCGKMPSGAHMGIVWNDDRMPLVMILVVINDRGEV